jgi:hypothetical protein
LLVASHLQKLCAIWLCRTSPPACAKSGAVKLPGGGEHTGEKSGEERKIATKTVWQFSTGSRKWRWRAHVHPERESEVVLPLRPLEHWAPCKARWVWVRAVTKYVCV